MNKYVVIEMSGSGLYSGIHPTHEEAMAQVDATEEKCIVVVIENMGPDTRVKVEDHT